MAEIRKYVDLDLNFKENPITKDISKTVDKMAIIRSVQNLVRTVHYEVPFNPDVGSNVEKLLFENLTPLVANSIKKEVEQTIEAYEPRVKIRFISVIPNVDENGYELSLEFYINNLVDPVAIEVFLERA